MPKGVHTNLNCQCCCCRIKRREFIKHKSNCPCGVCKAIRGEFIHKTDCPCCICKAKRGEQHLSEETIKKMSRIRRGLWQTSEYVSKQMKSRGVSPNKPEILLNSILQELFPNQYKYVGDGQVIIAGKCPDFINESEHKIIELFGDYWHKPEEEQQRINLFTKHGGYQTLIIWEHELKDLEKLKEKLLRYIIVYPVKV